MVFTWIYFYWVVKCKQNILHVWHPVCNGVIYPIDSNFYRWRSGLWCSMYVLIGQRYLRCDVCPHDLLVTLFESFDGAKKFLFYCFTMVWCFWRINELGKLRCSHFNISLCNHYSKQLFTLVFKILLTTLLCLYVSDFPTILTDFKYVRCAFHVTKFQNTITQGVKLRLIQALMRLNVSLWRPNPENQSPNWRLERFIITLPRDIMN